MQDIKKAATGRTGPIGVSALTAIVETESAIPDPRSREVGMATRTIPKLEALRGTSKQLSLGVGLAALLFSILYLVSDVMELAQAGFSPVQLTLTLAADAAIPFFVVGLYLLQRPRIGRLGLTGTILYAYTFAFFTGTVVFALMNSTKNWDVLFDQLGTWITIHGSLMIVAGVLLGTAVARAGVFPRWTGWTLVAGVVLIAASTGLPPFAQTASAAVRDLAFAGMGASLLINRRRSNATPLIPAVGLSDVKRESRAS